MIERCITHPFPARQERGNTIVHALAEESPTEIVWEELWVKDLGSNSFEICCIPMHVYNLSIGDIVVAEPHPRKGWVLKEVVHSSGEYTFRLLFNEQPGEEVMRRLHDELRAQGCLLEWRTARAWGVSCGPESMKAVVDVLRDWEERGILAYETGRT